MSEAAVPFEDDDNVIDFNKALNGLDPEAKQSLYNQIVSVTSSSKDAVTTVTDQVVEQIMTFLRGIVESIVAFASELIESLFSWLFDSSEEPATV